MTGLVYPPTCIACGAATGDPHALCAACWSGLRFIERPFCERLGTPFRGRSGEPLLSPAAIADPPVFGSARAVAQYDDAARALVHRLKYGDRLELARALGTMMVRAGRGAAGEADVIVPVPLHRGACGGAGSTRRWRSAASRGASGVPCDPFLLPREAHDVPGRADQGAAAGEPAGSLPGAARSRGRG